MKLVTLFPSKIISNYSNLQGKVFWASTERSLVINGQFIAGCSAKNLHKIRRNSDFILMKDYHHRK